MECPDGFECRKNVGKKKRKRGPVGTFTSLVCVKKNSLPAKNSLGHFLGSGSPWKLQSGEVTKENRRIRFISPHRRVSLQNSNLFLKLAKEMKIKISQNIGIRQKSTLHIYFQNSLSHRSRLLLRNARKVGANILWGIVS